MFLNINSLFEALKFSRIIQAKKNKDNARPGSANETAETGQSDSISCWHHNRARLFNYAKTIQDNCYTTSTNNAEGNSRTAASAIHKQ